MVSLNENIETSIRLGLWCILFELGENLISLDENIVTSLKPFLTFRPKMGVLTRGDLFMSLAGEKLGHFFFSTGFRLTTCTI